MYKQKANMKPKNKILKERRGITLIALVITIIVLLILAGVTIAFIVGEGGIIDQAQKARDTTNVAIQNEQQSLQNAEDLTNKYINDGPKEQLDPKQTLNVELKVEEENTTGKQIPVIVEKVTSSEGSNEPIGELTYKWYKDKIDGEGTEGGINYTFDNLDEEKEYTLYCKVINKNGEWGIGEVSLISFKVESVFYRAEKGLKWKEIDKYLTR